MGQRALESGILSYRRRLSGRGPLRSVVCTFGRCESCSSYGLRMVREHARSLPHALWLIVHRIGRCRTSSVYRRGRTLLWGQDYDRLDRVDVEAARVHEQPETRCALLRAAIVLACYRGERTRVPQLIARLRALRGGGLRARLPLRNGWGLAAHLRRRWCRRLAPALALSLMALFVSWLWAIAVGVTAAVLLTLNTRAYVAERRRMDDQLRLGQFSLR